MAVASRHVRWGRWPVDGVPCRHDRRECPAGKQLPQATRNARTTKTHLPVGSACHESRTHPRPPKVEKGRGGWPTLQGLKPPGNFRAPYGRRACRPERSLLLSSAYAPIWIVRLRTPAASTARVGMAPMASGAQGFGGAGGGGGTGNSLAALPPGRFGVAADSAGFSSGVGLALALNSRSSLSWPARRIRSRVSL